jgi:hypothetical protein
LGSESSISRQSFLFQNGSCSTQIAQRVYAGNNLDKASELSLRQQTLAADQADYPPADARAAAVAGDVTLIMLDER